MSAELYNKFNERDIGFIKKTMLECRDNGKKLILATHYPPTKKFNNDNPNYKPEYPSLYGNDLDSFIIEKNVHTWIFGHNHGILQKNLDININGTRVVTNQKGRGYNSMKDYSKTKRLCF